MKYYNVYYYCNIISAVIEKNGIDFASTLGEFKDRLWDVSPTDSPKYSLLHQFCEWAIDRIFREEMTKDIEEIQDLVDKYQEKYNLVGTLEKAFFIQSEYSLNKEKHYKRLRIEDAILQYRHQEVRFFDWLMQHQEYRFFDDEFSDYLEALCNEGLYYETISDIANEVFYILFQNRKFLLAFNEFISYQNPYEINRAYIPQWVKRAIHFRDRGKCIYCGKDLSGEFDVVGDGSIHLDHIVPLESGGLNDVANLQLMCADCNLHKSVRAFTTENYRNWYDITI